MKLNRRYGGLAGVLGLYLLLNLVSMSSQAWETGELPLVGTSFELLEEKKKIYTKNIDANILSDLASDVAEKLAHEAASEDKDLDFVEWTSLAEAKREVDAHLKLILRVTKARPSKVYLNYFVGFDELLFSIAVEAQSELNNGTISEGLRQDFGDNDISLSDDAFVSLKETDARWLIADGDKIYIIEKHEDRLDVYAYSSIRSVELFGSWGAKYTHEPKKLKEKISAKIKDNLNNDDFLRKLHEKFLSRIPIATKIQPIHQKERIALPISPNRLKAGNE